ncbi:shikimate dehydrogenase [Dethiosulfatarculus sandiegensis]|uniref:Shikimate dehydrogenase (NADP(+)) n=1 Tax=Dethiosulfatarculus sandiegensis TaxID=1429043 RepID=A0A0D2GCV3_9BACT|nr:shikimate dehydrogenase [Dethiosulfatarculus sandiegensis]KIX12797.1 shikimate dehydrogenase [Dethiosulfatarculus sandiegensis]
MKVFAVLGDQRAKASLSPQMHNQALFKAGINGRYVSFCVEPARLGQAVEGLFALGLAGANVTVPHKQKVIPFLQGLSDEAGSLGAVNTIEFTDNGMIGHNTDVPGFVRALEQAGFNPFNRRCLVMGAGGAARAVVAGLRQAKAKEIMVAARQKSRAEALCRDLGGTPLGIADWGRAAKGTDLLVNAASVSTRTESPELAALLSETPDQARPAVIMDLNYGRKGNLWQALARQKNAVFQDGLVMLAEQARLSFEIWTGVLPPTSHFLSALEQ